MDRSLQLLFGGVASSALIAGAVAAFISITALVAGTDFPNGARVAPPSGSHTVRIASQPHDAGAAPVSSPAAVRQLASVGRQLAPAPGLGVGQAADRPGRTASAASGNVKHSVSHGQGTSPGGSGHSSPGAGDGGVSPSSPPGSTPGTPPGAGTPPPTTGGGPPTGTPGNGSSGTPPGLANKPGGLPPGLASKPGGLPPGQASKAGGTPPGLASKPGGLPPGQAKKQ